MPASQDVATAGGDGGPPGGGYWAFPSSFVNAHGKTPRTAPDAARDEVPRCGRRGVRAGDERGAGRGRLKGDPLGSRLRLHGHAVGGLSVVSRPVPVTADARRGAARLWQRGRQLLPRRPRWVGPDVRLAGRDLRCRKRGRRRRLGGCRPHPGNAPRRALPPRHAASRPRGHVAFFALLRHFGRLVRSRKGASAVSVPCKGGRPSKVRWQRLLAVPWIPLPVCCVRVGGAAADQPRLARPGEQGGA
mmetsp:Transcript_25960/g.76092  ORF Transcript_25960/g.76092 Transcript_25960/m.76092 type:complete len:246 (+) Transcript_25960:670-1407(+)